MGTIANAVRRGGIYHFRRTIPEDLRARFGRRELSRSLGNCPPRVARIRADQLYSASEDLFAIARQDPMLTTDQLAKLVQDFYNSTLDRENQGRLLNGSMPEEIREMRALYWGNVADRARKALGANRLLDGEWVARTAAKAQGLDWNAIPPEDRLRCCQAVHRAGIDLADALKARYDGDFNFEPRDKLLRQVLTVRDAPASCSPAPPSPPAPAPVPHPEAAAGPLLSETFPQFLEAQVMRSWTKQTASQARSSFRLLIDVCGDRGVGSYTRMDAGALRALVERLPAAYGKSATFRNLSAQAIVEQQSGLDLSMRLPTISQTTVKRHFSALSTFWDDCVSRGIASTNIFTGFHFANIQSARHQRAMWTGNELRELFSSPVWTGCLSENQRMLPGHLILRDERFWIPLIGLFSGMRLEEICQLQVEDIKVQEGIRYFDVNDRPPRQLKNGNAVRFVPIHSELIRLGFITYVQRLQRRGTAAVFPNLQAGGADDKFGHGFSKWFTRYRRGVGVYRKKLDFHSLRHTATTLMHHADVSPTVLDHLTGHAPQGETRARYTKTTLLPQLMDAIEKIRPVIDLKGLWIVEQL